MSTHAIWTCRAIFLFLSFFFCGCDEGQPYPEKAIEFSTYLKGDSCCVAICHLSAPGGQLLSFRKVGSAWQLEQQLDLRAYGRRLRSGISLASNGQYLCVGADAPEKDPGQVLVFRRSDQGWKFLKSIAAPRGDQTSNVSDLFGSALAMSEDNDLFCGAPWSRKNGAVYVFKAGGDSIDMVQRIEPGFPVDGGHFGYSMAFSNGVLLIGACTVDNGEDTAQSHSRNVGGAYVYEFRSGSWVVVQSLQDALLRKGIPFYEFGNRVDIDGDDAVVVDRGHAYMFSRNDQGVWVYVQMIDPEDGGVGSVSLHDGVLTAGKIWGQTPK